ncbi:MAG: tRNA (guanosine(46)-N7)-methyltransferase TrmB [Nitrospirota bacterium]|nr:tRNA (guanosine(46)-N7)-methyltransferase TrmB [Nitrospirota bacterium]
MGSRVRSGGHIPVPPHCAVEPELLAREGWEGIFGRTAPLVVEVGFGNGQSLAEMARRQPECNFVGVERYGTGIEKLGKQILRENVANLRLIKGDGVETLESCFAPGSITAFHSNFPDPWPKLRHHKRRFVDPALAAILFPLLAPVADVFLATDHECYARQMRDVFEAHPGYVNQAGTGQFLYAMPGRIRTKYEVKFAARGATIHYLWYRRAERA